MNPFGKPCDMRAEAIPCYYRIVRQSVLMKCIQLPLLLRLSVSLYTPEGVLRDLCEPFGYTRRSLSRIFPDIPQQFLHLWKIRRFIDTSESRFGILIHVLQSHLLEPDVPDKREEIY